METRLLVDGREQSSLLAALGDQRGAQIELETLREVVLGLNLGAEDVGGGPRLGEDDTVGLVGVLGLDVTVDEVGLGVLGTSDLEGDVGGGGGLDLEGGAVEVEIPAQQVVGGLAEVLRVTRGGVSTTIERSSWPSTTTNSPSRTGERAGGETWLRRWVT